MATRISMWTTRDGKQFEAQEDAETHELVLDVSDLLSKAAEEHGCGIANTSAMLAASVLVETDVFYKLTVFLKGKL